MKIVGMDAAASSAQTISEQHLSETSISVASPRITTQEKAHKNEKTKADPVTEKMLIDALGKMNRLLEGTNRRFEYSVHDKINGIMVKVIDENTGEVIREIPPKKILDMVANMLEMAGLLVDERR